MIKNESTTSPRLEYFKSKDCFFCDGPVDPKTWVILQTHIYRDVEVISLVQTCRVCELFEQAVIEAGIESRRYTAVELERCLCGRVVHSTLGFCVLCWRQRRMISKELRELKLTRDIMGELRRRAKEIAKSDGKD